MLWSKTCLCTLEQAKNSFRSLPNRQHSEIRVGRYEVGKLSLTAYLLVDFWVSYSKRQDLTITSQWVILNITWMELCKTNNYKQKQKCSEWTWFIWRKKICIFFPSYLVIILEYFFFITQFPRKISCWFSVFLIKKLQVKDIIAKSSNGIVFFFYDFLEIKLKVPWKVYYRIGKYGKKISSFS